MPLSLTLSFLLSWTFFYPHAMSFNESISFLPGQHTNLLHFKYIFKGKWYLHLTQQGVVTGVGGEVLLQNGHSARESHMPTATEQGDPGEAEDGGHQRGIGDSSQTLDAALKAAWTQRRENAAVVDKMPPVSRTPHIAEKVPLFHLPSHALWLMAQHPKGQWGSGHHLTFCG